MGYYWDARGEDFDLITIKGTLALLSIVKLKPETIPEGFFRYEIRHDDESGDNPVQLAKSVFCNHWGTIITAEEIKLDEDGSLELVGGDLDYLGETMGLDEFVEIS